MNEMVWVVTLVGSLLTTSYRSVPEQTDASPFITSIGERVNEHGIAVSQDLLRSGAVKYGDHVYIEDVGFKVVNDCLNARHRNHIDVWVDSLAAEKKFHKKFKGRKLKVYLVRVQKASK